VQFPATFDGLGAPGEHDPMLASFVVGVITEASHHPELRKELSKLPPRQEIFLSELCTNAKSRGELPESLPVQSAIDAMSGVIAGFSRLAVTVRDRERLLAAATVYKSMARSALSRAGV
jgi:hypothetical protein